MGMLFKVSESKLRGEIQMTVDSNVVTYSEGGTINLGTIAGYDYDFTVDWGDGSAIETYTTPGCTHKFPVTATGETYTVIINGLIERLNTYDWNFDVTFWDYQIGETNLKYVDLGPGVTVIGTDNYHVTFTEVVGAKLKRLYFRSGGINKSCLGSIINPTNLRTQSITDMSNMFNGSKLVSLDVSSWDTGNVTNMGTMFASCWALETINTDSWDVSKVTNMSWMFHRSQLITSNATEAWWDGSNPQITSYSLAFSYNTARPNYASIPAGWK